jgi:hypothetical protein
MIINHYTIDPYLNITVSDIPFSSVSLTSPFNFPSSHYPSADFPLFHINLPNPYFLSFTK